VLLQVTPYALFWPEGASGQRDFKLILQAVPSAGVLTLQLAHPTGGAVLLPAASSTQAVVLSPLVSFTTSLVRSAWLLLSCVHEAACHKLAHPLVHLLLHLLLPRRLRATIAASTAAPRPGCTSAWPVRPPSPQSLRSPPSCCQAAGRRCCRATRWRRPALWQTRRLWTTSRSLARAMWLLGSAA
jgi:hypothetical protein